MRDTEEPDEFSLQPGRVLVLINEYGLVPSDKPGGSFGLFHEQTMDEEEEVVVVEPLLCPFGIVKETMQLFNLGRIGFVLRVDPGDRVGDRGHAIGSKPIDSQEGSFIRESFELRQVLFAREDMEEAGTFRFVQDGETRGEAESGAVSLEPGRGHAMEGAAVDVVPRQRIDLLHAVQHLSRRFAGKRDEQDAAGVNPGCDQPGGAVHEDFGFTATGAGDD